MSRLGMVCCLGMAVLALLGSVPTTVDAAGKIVVYFDINGEQRWGVSPGLGQTSIISVFGEEFDADFVTGVQYAVDYGPDLTFLADLALPPVSIGDSQSGISIGFGNSPKPGSRFLVHFALVQWNNNCRSTFFNGDVRTLPHPQFPDPTPVVTRFPDQAVEQALATRSQTCQLVEMDIAPLICPNVFPVSMWHEFGVQGKPRKGTWMAVAILGSETVDVATIDQASIRLEGLAAIPPPGVLGVDIGFADGANQCSCAQAGAQTSDVIDTGKMNEADIMNLLSQSFVADGHDDIILFFERQNVAKVLFPMAPKEGTEFELTLTGAYVDGTPFRATGCVQIVGPANAGRSDTPLETATMGLPTPNPFNPVSRISFELASAQRVHIAIYDVAGRRVQELMDEVKTAGKHIVEWDAGNLPSGVYFYRMTSGGKTIVRRTTLLK